MISWDMDLACVQRGYNRPRPEVSVVMMVYDFGKPEFLDTLNRAIVNVRRSTPSDADIIIVANGTIGKFAKLLQQHEQQDRRITVISMRRNLGCVAKNFGYNLAQGRYILSVDGDVIVKPGWVEKFVGALKKDKTVGLVGPCGVRMLVDEWTEVLWGGANRPGYGFGYDDPLFFGSQDKSGKDGTLVDSIPSMCWGFRRECLDKAGYLNWRFGPLVGSDADFCFRVKLAGWKLQIIRAPIYHVDGGGGRGRVQDPEILTLKTVHTKLLYVEWYPKRKQVLHQFTGK